MKNKTAILGLLAIFVIIPSFWDFSIVNSPNKRSEGTIEWVGSVLIDSTNTLTIEDVSTSGIDKFEKMLSTEVNYGRSSSIFWIKLSIPNPRPNIIVKISYPLLDHVDMYYKKNGSWQVEKSGDQVPFSDRSVDSAKIVFKLGEPAKELTDIYLKISSSGSIQIPIELMDYSNYRESEIFVNRLDFTYIGIMITLIFFNLLIGLFLKDPIYLKYVTFLTLFTLFQVTYSGISYQLLWPDQAEFNNRVLQILAAAVFVLMSSFSRSYLRTEERLPRVNRFVLYLEYIWIVIILTQPFLTASQAFPILILYPIPYSVVLLSIGFYSVLRFGKEAYFYLLGWFAFILAIVSNSLVQQGILPTSEYTSHIMQLGSATEGMLFALGLAYRFKVTNDMLIESQNLNHKIEKKNTENAAIAMATKMLAHDVRAPFTMIKTILSFLKTSNIPDPTGQMIEEFSGEVESAIHDVEIMLHDIMDVGRDINLNKININMEAVIKRAIERVLASSQGNDTTFFFDFQNQNMVKADDNRLLRVFINIIGNAVEAMNNSGKIEIHTLDTKDQNTRITIKNFGSSIPASQIDKIFDNFYTHGKKNGTGLGLAITKKFVILHDGKIWCESDADSVTFIIEIPNNQ